MGLLQRRVAIAAVFLAVFGLAGCFDVSQKVGINRMGAGRYEVAVSAQGVAGDAIKNEKLVNRQNRATLTTLDNASGVTRKATVDFQTLSNLSFSDETMNLTVKSTDLFGLGPSHVVYVADVMIDKAKNEDSRAASADDVGEKVAETLLGDHTYTFAVTVPGDVEVAVPVTVDDVAYQPTVVGDFYNGRTVIWKIPLYAVVAAPALRFEVDFWAWGFFKNAQSQLVAND